MAQNGQPRGNYFALGLFVGMALGTVLALLFAPAPGEQTRAVLREKGIELQSRAGEVAKQARPRAVEEAGEEAPPAAEVSQG